jgi:hypothetical protein
MDLQSLLGFFQVNFGDQVQTTSHIFAKWLGLYLVIMSIYTLWRGRGLDVIKEEVRRSPALLLLIGGLNVLLGSLLIATHSIFVWSWPLLITILGYIFLFKGIMELYFTREYHELHERLGYNFIRLWAIVWLIIGLILLWFGYFART